MHPFGGTTHPRAPPTPGRHLSRGVIRPYDAKNRRVTWMNSARCGAIHLRACQSIWVSMRTAGMSLPSSTSAPDASSLAAENRGTNVAPHAALGQMHERLGVARLNQRLDRHVPLGEQPIELQTVTLAALGKHKGQAPKRVHSHRLAIFHAMRETIRRLNTICEEELSRRS